MAAPPEHGRKMVNIDNEDWEGDSDCEAYCRISQDLAENAAEPESDSNSSDVSDSSNSVFMNGTTEEVWPEERPCPNLTFPAGTEYSVSFDVSRPGCFVSINDLAAEAQGERVSRFLTKNGRRAYSKWREGCLNGSVPFTKAVSPWSIFPRILSPHGRVVYDEIQRQKLIAEGKGKQKEVPSPSCQAAAANFTDDEGATEGAQAVFRDSDANSSDSTSIPGHAPGLPTPSDQRANIDVESVPASEDSQSFRTSDQSVSSHTNSNRQSFRPSTDSIRSHGKAPGGTDDFLGHGYVGKSQADITRQATAGNRAASVPIHPSTGVSPTVSRREPLGPGIINKLVRDFKRPCSMEPTTPRKVAKVAAGAAASGLTNTPLSVREFPQSRGTSALGAAISSAAPFVGSPVRRPATPANAILHAAAAALRTDANVTAPDWTMSTEYDAADDDAYDGDPVPAAVDVSTYDDVPASTCLPVATSTPAANASRIAAAATASKTTASLNGEVAERVWASPSTTMAQAGSSDESTVSHLSSLSGMILPSINGTPAQTPPRSRAPSPSLREFGERRRSSQTAEASFGLIMPTISIASSMRWVVMVGKRPGIYYNSRNADDAAGGVDGARVLVFNDMDSASQAYAHGIATGAVVEIKCP